MPEGRPEPYAGRSISLTGRQAIVYRNMDNHIRLAAPEKSAAPPPTLVTYFSPSELAPNPEQVARYAGGSRYRMEKRHHGLVNQALEQALEICRPVMAYALHPVLARPREEGELVLKSGARLELPVSLVGRRTQSLSVAVATIGKELEQACRRMREQGDLLRSIFLDAAGLAMLELLEKAAFEIICGLARERGLFAGYRLAPGCCGLDMSLQQSVFNLVDGAAIGVFLNSSLVMTPLKSQSFLAGLTPDPAPATPWPKCLSCPSRDCLFRHTDRL